MIKNYFAIAFRSLWRTKVHSSVNILGLGLGIASCILIVLFVRDEWTFDTFHTKVERIYRANVKEDWGESQQFFNTSSPFPLGPVLKENFQQVEKEVRILKFNPQVKVGENQYTDFVTIAGQDFFDVFDFEVSKGNKNALHEMSGIVLSQSIAKKYFGEEDPINKVISIQIGENFEDFTVQAIVNHIPSNSSIHFGVLISDLNFTRMFDQQVLTSSWFNVNPETYVLLKEGVNVNELLTKFPALFKNLIGEDYAKSKYTVGLQPMTDIHLNTEFPAAIAPVSNPRYSYILSAIAGLILFVACINFITLSLGRSLQRAKEVGIRKVVGAARRQLIFQFIGEAILFTILAMSIGFGLALLNLPLFNDLAEKTLSLRFEWFTFQLAAVLVMLIGVIAGSYPAFVLSGFKPISILKGKIQSNISKQGVRKSLVGVQLVLSIFLISSTILMRQQLQFLQNRDLGFNRDQLAVIQLHPPKVGRLPERVQAGFGIVEQFKLELTKYPGIAGVCGASHDFGNGAWTAVGFTDDQGTYRNFSANFVDDDYVPTLNMQLSAGRNFSADNPSDKRRSILVNEAFVKAFGWKDAIGKRIPGKNFKDNEIIGVVKDFNFASLYTKVDPLVIAMDASIVLSGAQNISIDNSPIPKLIVRMRPGEMANTIDHIKTAYEKVLGNEEFSFSFVDQTLAQQYKSDQNLGKIVSVATILAILIGSFGLYGLASLAMQNRTREISIRKVLGATEKSLLMLLSREYVLLIVICLFLSVPMTYFTINEWLKSFEYRVDIGAGAFLIAGSISLGIALATISYQALKTAASEPAENLKCE